MKKAFLFVFLSVPAVAADITGSWYLTVVQFGEETSQTRVDFTSDGEKLRGVAFAGTIREMRFEGTSINEDVRFSGAFGSNGSQFGSYEGRIQGANEMNGTFRQGDNQATWKARRLNPATGPSTTHTFDPVKFHRVFSGVIEPALQIRPGDTVRTWTVDARGVDAKGVRRSLGGNPQTGPFYVDGALPGDTLAVKFLRVRLNRDFAMSGVWIGPAAVTPLYFRDTKYDSNFGGRWKLDRQSGQAVLAAPTPRLKSFTVPLHPMVGCVAVAPPGKQSLGTSSLGSFGGNMDYNGLTEGVTVYLPVYVPGALLFVGDGHAAQGDGELNGDALETSLDLEFTVDLIRGQDIPGPRRESVDSLMASGVANTLNEALQQATTSLARWLARDYNLSPTEVAMVLGTSIRYDIAEVVDPVVHIVARMNKDLLTSLRQKEQEQSNK